jgi:hypothetical protein
MTSSIWPISSTRAARADAVRVTVLGCGAAGPNPGAGCSGYLDSDRATRVEATFLESKAPGSYLTAREAGRLATDCRAQETVLCHLWAELG